MINAPVNNKGGILRQFVERETGLPVHGMQIIEGRWFVHTAHQFAPMQRLVADARRAKIERDSGIVTRRPQHAN